MGVKEDIARCFIALDLDEHVREKIARLQEDLDAKGLFKGKFTEKENIHLTLKFLGEITEEKIDTVKTRVSHIRMNRFNAQITKAGVFTRKAVRIVWLALDSPEVRKLQSVVDTSLEKHFTKERRFMGHITIARVKKVYDTDALLEYLDSLDPRISVDVASFSLRSSVLTHTGPEYSILERYHLL
ncbi:MAG: RNA 2',3'-cyclic phosphodiesterase [Candidatus Woesearchaeota archaeon]